ncbi:hypothetical protein EV178_000192 [Coemansia sp. RSA 1646]|nr:hypothetical protein EV178_000192 [Coemansia sp. RSA 1646]
MAPIDIVISRTEGSICAAVAEELELAVSELTGGLYEGVPAGGDGARSAVATPSHAPPGDDMRSTGLANAVGGMGSGRISWLSAGTGER